MPLGRQKLSPKAPSFTCTNKHYSLFVSDNRLTFARQTKKKWVSDKKRNENKRFLTYE